MKVISLRLACQGAILAIAFFAAARVDSAETAHLRRGPRTEYGDLQAKTVSHVRVGSPFHGCN
jgi:hypothetical protein